MNVRHVPALLTYSPDKMRKVGLVDTPNLFCDAYCLEPGQEQTAHRHGMGDKLYYVVASSSWSLWRRSHERGVDSVHSLRLRGPGGSFEPC